MFALSLYILWHFYIKSTQTEQNFTTLNSDLINSKNFGKGNSQVQNILKRVIT